MKWRIDYSRDAQRFINEHNIQKEIKDEITNFLLKMKAENINVDIKKLYGKWQGYYRLRRGKIRIIFEVNKSEKVLYIEKVDFRGDVYK
jgi:mRNA-degrading endonuclease RelE of RelBE toxin-antitoxin system